MNHSNTILVIVAHPDDELLGCGASIAKWTASGILVHVLIMAEGITSRDVIRDKYEKSGELSQLEKLAHQAGKILGVNSVTLLGFPDNRMDSLDRLDVIKAAEKEIERLKPDTVVTHHSGDLNIDHRIINEAVVTACRPQPENTVHRILSFEVPSSTEWQSSTSILAFQPNWFEDVSKTIDKKIEALKIYQSEMREWPHSRSLKNIINLSKYRGSSVGREAVEAFVLLREIK